MNTTQMTLKEEINALQFEISMDEKALAQKRERLEQKLKSRFNCAHSFTKPLPGFEHEGGQCEYCGINEVYWLHNKK